MININAQIIAIVLSDVYAEYKNALIPINAIDRLFNRKAPPLLSAGSPTPQRNDSAEYKTILQPGKP
jgi:hypothetical protein